MSVFIPPAIRRCTDVNLSGLAGGDLLRYNASNGVWEVIPESTLVPRGEFNTGPILAGAFVTIGVGTNIRVVTGVAVVDTSTGSDVQFTQWECIWVSSAEQTNGRYLGVGVTTFTSSTPPTPVGANCNFRIVNRSAGNVTNLKVLWAGVNV